MNKVIGTIIALISIVGSAFAVDSFYMRRAEAQERADQTAAQVLALQRELSAQQERDKIENELQVIRLEIEFLSTQYDAVDLTEREKEKLKERKQYLRKREEIREQRLLEMRDKE